MCRLSWHLGASISWKPQGLFGPVMGLLYFTYIHHIFSRPELSPDPPSPYIRRVFLSRASNVWPNGGRNIFLRKFGMHLQSTQRYIPEDGHIWYVRTNVYHLENMKIWEGKESDLLFSEENVQKWERKNEKDNVWNCMMMNSWMFLYYCYCAYMTECKVGWVHSTKGGGKKHRHLHISVATRSEI